MIGWLSARTQVCVHSVQVAVIAMTDTYLQGMTYLEDRGIVHRDLAARNVLGKGNNLGNCAAIKGNPQSLIMY